MTMSIDDLVHELVIILTIHDELIFISSRVHVVNDMFVKK